jgi:transposase InsO family protein
VQTSRKKFSIRTAYLIHAFDDACEQAGIEHRFTKPGHPWTNGQVEHKNRTLKEATVKRYHYETHQQLKEHLYSTFRTEALVVVNYDR